MRSILLSSAALILLAGCAKDGEFVDAGGGVRMTRSACPAVAIPAYTGDVTLFDPPASREARAIDVVATITNLRNTCNSASDPVTVTATFDVQARRSAAGPARDVVLPYFSTVMRSGTQVVSKQVGRIALRFAAGEVRATAQGQASATISLAAATLDPAIQEQISRKRKAGDEEAAVDPMTDPVVKAAVQKAAFELLIGWQLTTDQLGYNATR